MKKLFAMLLALVMVLSLAACANDDNTTTSSTKNESTNSSSTGTSPEVNAMTHAEYVAAEDGSKVEILAYVQAYQVSAKDNVISIYAQDKDGGYFIYGVPYTAETAAKLQKGVKIHVSGSKGSWNGEMEVMEPNLEVIDDNDQYVADACDVTALMDKDELIDHQNELVAIKGLTVAASKIENDDKEYAFLYNWNGSGSEGDDLYITVMLGDAKYSICVESDLCNKDSEVYKAVQELKIGDVIDVEAFLYWYNGAEAHVTSVKKAA